MIPTPFLKGFNTEGGTLYVFPSVSKDLTRTFVSNDYEFKFSHFACLNLPDIILDKYVPEESDSSEYNFTVKQLYINTLTPADWSFNNTKLSNALTEHFQNYIMNFETAILNGEGDNDDYDNDIMTNVSEKVFFNWLQKVGAIQFTENGGEEAGLFADRTIPYIGNIDVMNTVEINGDAFEEIYIHIPSTVGASTHVYFRTGELTDNKNYLNKNYSLGSNGEKLEGRDTTENPFDDSIYSKPFVDIDDGVNVYKGDIGHTIDFRNSSYPDGISNMNSQSLEDFEFNAILIYYDVLEKTNQANTKKIATNLYGILFLNNVIEKNNAIYIERYPKKRETVYGNGNSFALKLDLKVDTIGDTNATTIEKIYNPNDVYAMALYEKALIQLQDCIDLFYTQKNEIVKLRERVSTLENLVMGMDSIVKIQEDITRLYDLYSNYMAVDTSTLLGLIEANSKKLNNIMNGGKDLKLQYDTDVLQPGPGIGMTKTPNKVIIRSESKYAVNTVTDGNYPDEEIEITPENPMSTIATSKICNIKLQPGENFAVIYLRDEGDSETNLNIKIDDSDYNWEIGQSMKLYFICDEEGGSLRFDINSNKGVVIKPKNNVTLTVDEETFEGNDLIEIVCLGEDKFIYFIK